MKKFFYVAIAATALASCSSDNLVDLKEGDEIKFTAVADNDSRAAAVWCNNNIPSDFRVWANSGGKAFMNDEVYTKVGDVYTSDVIRYWPESAGVDFYALKFANPANPGETGTISYTSGSQPEIADYQPATDVDKQQDIIYATTPGATKTTNGVVQMNFRHALSQIEFMAKNTYDNIEVIVKEVCVGNAVGKGTFTLPATTTLTDVFVDATHGTSSTSPATFNQGTWTYPDEKVYTDYSVAVQSPSTALTSTASSLTLSTGANITTTNHATSSVLQSMMLIPSGSATTQWNPVDGNLNSGSYLGINVEIYNVVEVADDVNSPYKTLVYTGWAYVPASFNWEQGKRYVYTFNFAKGTNGGFREDGKPVLTDINLNVTVDDFIWAGNTDTEMDTTPGVED